MNGSGRSNFSAHYTAEQYDRLTERFLSQFDEVLEVRVQQEFRLQPAAQWLLDVGCGTSRFLLRLANHTELQTLRFVALDYFEEMTVLSRKNCASQGCLDRVAVCQGDVHQLQFPSNSFDLVISRSTLHHWADPVAALGEIDRVLSPTGVALIHEIRRDPDPDALALFNRQREAAGVEASRMDEKYTLEEIRSFVACAGLEERSSIRAPSRGISSLGCEIRIEGQ